MNSKTDEELENDFFKICCDIEGIDPMAKNARKLLKAKQRKKKICERLLKVWFYLKVFSSALWFIMAGYNLAVGSSWWFITISLFFGIFINLCVIEDAQRRWYP